MQQEKEKKQNIVKQNKNKILQQYEKRKKQLMNQQVNKGNHFSQLNDAVFEYQMQKKEINDLRRKDQKNNLERHKRV